MEVVVLEPLLMRIEEPALARVVQRAQAAGVLEDEVDHLGGDAEVGDNQHGDTGSHRLQRRGRGDGDEGRRCVERLGHRPGAEPQRIGRNQPLGDQLRPQLGICPGLTVGLLLPVSGTQLDHCRPAGSLCQGLQQLPPIVATPGHLGLSGKYHVRTLGPERRGLTAASEEREPRKGEPHPGGELLT